MSCETVQPATSVAESIPAEMRATNNWVLWRYETRKGKGQGDGKLTKVPYQPNGYHASTTNAGSWSSYETVAAKFAEPANTWDGIGFVFTEPFAGVDFDNVRNPETGEISPAALKRIHALDSYTEVSPSGRGVHVIVNGRLEGDGKKKPHIEVYDDARFFAVTGHHVSGTPTTVNARESALRQTHASIETINDELTPKSSLIIRPDAPKFLDLMHGDWQPYYKGVSEAVQGLLCMLAVKHHCDRSKMDESFRESGLYADHSPDHANWIEKWDRLSESELDKAIAFVQKLQPAPVTNGMGEFTRPRTPRTENDGLENKTEYVVQRRAGQFEGWFPKGEISVVAGSSGSGKSTFVIDLLEKQRSKTPLFGHQTSGMSFLILMVDRGEGANRRTLQRMHIEPASIPVKHLRGFRDDALRGIREAVESCPTIPEVLFIEGLDLLMENGNDTRVVASFMFQLQGLANYYNIAIVVSSGAPKQKTRDFYVGKRDQIIGTQAWARVIETVVVLQYEGGDDTLSTRVLTVLPRQQGAESFNLKFENGRLVENTAVEVVTETAAQDDVNAWIFSQKIGSLSKTVRTRRTRITKRLVTD